jgi:hypothetical protein
LASRSVMRRARSPERGWCPVRVEVSFQASGTLLRIPVNDMGTYVSVARPDGTLFGGGRESPSPTRRDGRVEGSGRRPFHRSRHGGLLARAIYFAAASGRLARLDGIAAVFESDTDETGKSEDKTFEWR